MQAFHVKKLLLTCFLLSTLISYAQTNDSTFRTSNLGLEYKKRSQDARRVGFILLGAGSACFIGGAFASLQNIFSDSRKGELAGLAGTGMLLASIPVFITAKKDKRKSKMFL